MKKYNILVCSDSFKGSLSSRDIIDIYKEEAHDVENVIITGVEIADGGEGTLDAISQFGKYEWKEIECFNPLFERIRARYLLDQEVAIIEMAQASGITLIPYKDGNAAKTTTFGTGELILDAIKNGANHIFITVGGSATNDGGIGALSALGYDFLDKDGNSLKPIGENLIKISNIDTSKAIDTNGIEFTVVADVENKLLGKKGATYVYGPQKGAVGEIKEQLEEGMKNYNSVVKRVLGVDMNALEHGGAAGGLAAGLIAFLNANVQSGIETLLDLIDFNTLLSDADAVITGEGCLDEQSLQGKVVCGITKRCIKKNVPVYVMAGITKIQGAEGIKRIKTLREYARDSEDSILNAKIYARIAAKEMLREIVEDIKG